MVGTERDSGGSVNRGTRYSCMCTIREAVGKKSFLISVHATDGPGGCGQRLAALQCSDAAPARLCVRLGTSITPRKCGHAARSAFAAPPQQCEKTHNGVAACRLPGSPGSSTVVAARVEHPATRRSCTQLSDLASGCEAPPWRAGIAITGGSEAACLEGAAAHLGVVSSSAHDHRVLFSRDTGSRCRPRRR